MSDATRQHDLYNALRGDRAVEKEGVLHLDRAAARAKMSAFTLPAPYYWVLQIVRLAVLSGATRIEFDVSVRSVEVRLDVVLDPALLKDIWNVALDPRVTRQQQAIRYLALGLSAARALGPQELLVRSGAVELLSEVDRDVTRSLEQPIDGTQVRCLEKFRLAHVAEFVHELFQKPAELVVLSDFAKFAPLHVVVNGATISSPHLHVAEIELGSVYLHNVDRNCVDVCAQLGGVRVHQHLAHRPMNNRGYDGFGGWVIALESDALPLDLSTMSLSQHDELGPTEISRTALGELWRYLVADTSRITALAVAERRSLFAMVMSQAKSPEVTALIMAMLDVPMFEACGTGAVVSLEETMRDFAVCYSSENFDVDLGDEPPVAWIEDTQLANFLPWAGVPAEDMTQELQAITLREMNLARWRKRPELPLEGVIVGDPTPGAEQLHGSIVLAPLGEGAIRFCHQQRIVQEVPLSVPLFLQVDGPLTFNRAFDEVVHTAASHAFIETMIRAVPQAFHNVDHARAYLLVERIAWSHLDEELRNAAKISATSVDERTWLERLGALADLRLVATVRGYSTVRELLTVEPAPLVASVSSGIGGPTDIVLKPDGALTASMGKMRPAIEKEADRWLARHHEHRFRLQPLYEVRNDRSSFQYESTRAGAKFLLMLESKEAGLAEVTLVYEGRFLAKHLWKSSHYRWRVVVWWDEFTPTIEFRDVERDEALRKAQLIFLEVERDAVEEVMRRDQPHTPVEHDESWLRNWHDVAGGASVVVSGNVEIEGAVSIVGNVVFESPSSAPPPYYASITDDEPEEELGPEAFTPPPPEPLTPEEQALREQRRLAARSGELHRVFSLLAFARNDRHELLGDFMLNRLALRAGSAAWKVGRDGASIGTQHPLAALRGSTDPVEIAFLASGAATAINAYYRDFSDTHELHLQASLLTAPLAWQKESMR